MRVARELPKLDAANTPRVADLSFRQVLDLTASNAKELGRLPEHDKVEVLERAEKHTQPVRYIATGLKHERELAADEHRIRFPDGDDPRGAERPITVRPIKDGGIHRWKVRLGCNEVGRRLPELAQLEAKKPTFLARLSAVDEMKRRSKELAAESKRLESVARQEEHQINRDIMVEIEAQHGPCFPYVHWQEIEVSPALQNKLVAAANDKERFLLLQRTRQAPRWICGGVAGDINLFKYEMPGPPPLPGLAEEDELEIDEPDEPEFCLEHPGMDEAFVAFNKYLGGRDLTWDDAEVLVRLLKEADERALAHAS
jgi:hypothetical protein